VRSDENIQFRARDEGELGDFGETTPSNSFSGGERDHLFLSDKGKQFYDLGGVSGLDHPGDGRTFCVFDYDRDGWKDFCVVSANAPTVQLYRNRVGDQFYPEAEGARMIALRFVGGNKTSVASTEWSPRSGYGAIVEAHVGGAPLLREYRCGDGRSAVNSMTMFIGAGDAPSVQKVDVRWPAGGSQSAADIPLGSLVTFYENPADSPNGQAYVVEPYLRNALDSQVTNGAAQGERLALTLPASDAPARLNLVTAMATHCATCKARQPEVKLIREEFGGADVAVWGVGTDLEEDQAALDAYVAAHQPEYDVLSGLPMAERQAVRDHVRARYGEDLTPVTIVTDAQGNVLDTVPGIPSVSDIIKLLARLDAGR
jgi:hypothetical protein